ncbi:MAG: hypothetical protein H7232_00600 [Aeromicrobium sp.]|nr:hypothetical protein [Burkholderiales bacterium]
MHGRFPAKVLEIARPAWSLLLFHWWALLAWRFPRALFRLLFASAAGKDTVLAGEPEFQSSMIKILR